jgi:uncharacterized membrane protein
MFDTGPLDYFLVMSAILVPLGIWKLVEIIIYVLQHIHWG